MDRHQPVYRFDFNHEPIIDEEIYPERRLEDHASEFGTNQPLSVDAVAHRFQPRGQESLVHRLEQARAQLAMQAERDVKDVAGNLVYVPHPSNFCSAPPTSSPRLRVNP